MNVSLPAPSNGIGASPRVRARSASFTIRGGLGDGALLERVMGIEPT
jgi:hypothetical protein